MMTRPVRDVLGALLRREAVPWDEWSALDPESFSRAAERQGVLPLIVWSAGGVGALPPAVSTALGRRYRLAVARDLAREMATARLVEALARAGVRALIFKGAELAYTHYPRPDLRPRLDVDLLVRESDRDRAGHVLFDLGYRAELQAGTEGVLYQRAYVGPRDAGCPLVLDLHWAVANPEVFRHVLSFDELEADAVEIPALGPQARGFGGVHALVASACHRVAHHAGDDRLIWLYDIHLLARRFSADEWRRFSDLAIARGVRDVCAAGLNAARMVLDTPVPADLWAAARRETESESEVTAGYLDAGRPHALVVLDDLRALTTWRGRMRVIQSHAFPPKAYMREVYAPSSRAPLAWLYVVRLARGARKWTRRGAAEPDLDSLTRRPQE